MAAYDRIESVVKCSICGCEIDVLDQIDIRDSIPYRISCPKCEETFMEVKAENVLVFEITYSYGKTVKEREEKNETV